MPDHLYCVYRIHNQTNLGKRALICLTAQQRENRVLLCLLTTIIYIIAITDNARKSSFLNLLLSILKINEAFLNLLGVLIVGSNNFSAQFIKMISHYKRIGYNINVLQQTACLVVNPITVGNFVFLFNCTPVGRTSDSMMDPT